MQMQAQHTVHLMDGSDGHGILSACPRWGQERGSGHRPTRPRTCDSAAGSSDIVRQTAAENCSARKNHSTLNRHCRQWIS